MDLIFLGGEQMIKLYVLKGPCKGQSFDLKSDDTIIGRSPDNDIQIKDRSVSRSHLRIVRKIDDLSIKNLRSTLRKTNRYFIKDLRSTNGTMVDGVKISPGIQIEINEGDPIAIGKSVICLGEKCLKEVQEVQAVQDSVDLPKKSVEKDKDLRTRPFTLQKNMELMFKVCGVLMESLDMDDILGTILDHILDLFKRIDRGFIFLIDTETKSILKEISRVKDRRAYSGIGYSQDIVNKVIEDNEPTIISDVYAGEVDEFSDTWKILKIGSVMCVPLMSKSQLWGVIYLDAIEKAYSFRDEDLTLLTALSSPIALAIENAFLNSSDDG